MRIIFFLMALFSSNAFAGAYSLQCSSEDGSVKIEKASLSIEGKYFEYYADESVRLMGLPIVDFLKETNSKVVVSAPDTQTDIAQGGVKVVTTKNFQDECGNQGTETKYKEAVGIYQIDGTTLVNVAHLKCTERIITGHCR